VVFEVASGIYRFISSSVPAAIRSEATLSRK